MIEAYLAAYITGVFVFGFFVWFANRDVPDPIQRELAPFMLGLLWPAVFGFVICLGVVYVALRFVHLVFGFRKDRA